MKSKVGKSDLYLRDKIRVSSYDATARRRMDLRNGRMRFERQPRPVTASRTALVREILRRFVGRA